MDNGNGGPGFVDRGFERSMAEAPDFNPERNPEVLPTPDQREDDPGIGAEVGNNPNSGAGMYLDPSMLGKMTNNAAQYGEELNPALGEVVTEPDGVGMKKLTEDQILGGSVKNKFDKDGVPAEVADEIDNLKKENDLYRMSVNISEIRDRMLAGSFENRKSRFGGDK